MQNAPNTQCRDSRIKKSISFAKSQNFETHFRLLRPRLFDCRELFQDSKHYSNAIIDFYSNVQRKLKKWKITHGIAGEHSVSNERKKRNID